MLPKQLLILFLLLLTLAQCKTNKNNIRVKGRAFDSKAGACVIDKADKIYFITNKYEWPKEFYGKKLIVKGKLSVLYDTCKIEGSLPLQRIEVKYSIDSAKYRVTIFGFKRKVKHKEEG